jgi:hypothetical protein
MKKHLSASIECPLPRRQFLKISASGIITGGVLIGQPIRADENDLKEIAKRTLEAAKEKIKENIPDALKPQPFMLKELVFDHDQAKKDYAKLLELIPTAERLRLSKPLQGRNAYLELLKIKDQYVSEFTFDKSDTFSERFGEGLSTPIPWPDEAFYSGPVKDYLKRNEKFYLSMIEEIKKADYWSVDDSSEAKYRKTDDLESSIGDVNLLRSVAYSFQHLTCALAREEQWSKAYDLLELWTKLYVITHKGKMLLVNYLVLKSCWSIFCESIDKLCNHPSIPDEWLVKYSELLKKSPDFRVIFKSALVSEFQEWVLSYVAAVPELENPKFQYLATKKLVHPDSKLPASKEKSKLLKLLQPEAVSEQHKSELEFSEKIGEIFTNKQKLFDRANTVEEGWAIIRSVLRFIDSEKNLDQKVLWKMSEEYRNLDLIRNRGQFESMFSTADEDRDGKVDKTQSEAIKEVSKIENPLGKFLIQENFVIYSHSNRLFRPGALEIQRAIQIRVALKLYEKKHKERPTTLAILEKEKFLKPVPTNPFTDEEWGYNAVRGIIWRTGKEGTADGTLENIEIEKKLPPAERRKETEIIDEETQNGIFRFYKVGS